MFRSDCELFGIAKFVPCPSCLPRRLRSAGTGRVADAELVGVKEHGIAIRQVQLLLLPLQTTCSLLYARNESLANGGSEQLVLFLRNVDFVIVRVLDLVLGILVLVLLTEWRLACGGGAAAAAAAR